MCNLLIVSRGSLSSKKFTLSRSMYCRVIEPLFYLAEKRSEFSISIKSIEEISSQDIVRSDVLIFCKHNTNESVALATKAIEAGKKIIYDIDDLIYRFTKDSLAYDHMDNIPFLRQHLEFADEVVISTQTLADHLQNDFKLKSYSIIPTGINTDKFSKVEYLPGRKNILFTNGDNIKISKFKSGFIEVFNSFLDTHQDASFDVFGDSQEYLTEFRRFNFLGSLPWDQHKEYLQKTQYDLAIIPLGGEEEDSAHQAFSSCKTPIKYLEYAALRIPGVYSNAFIYKNVIKNFETGFLVDNDKTSWGNALHEVFLNYPLLKKVTDKAFEDVHSNHHIKYAAEKWAAVIHKHL